MNSTTIDSKVFEGMVAYASAEWPACATLSQLAGRVSQAFLHLLPVDREERDDVIWSALEVAVPNFRAVDHAECFSYDVYTESL